MDKFYQDLRKIQKKERNSSKLAHVEETFYGDVQDYVDKLKKQAVRDPFSNAHGILKDTQIIATEICERRENKIAVAAVRNIQRSYLLFTGNKPQFDLVDTTPLNLTPEEEKFYYSVIDSIKNHRGLISIEKLTEDEDESKPQENTFAAPIKEIKEPSKPPVEEKPKTEIIKKPSKNIEENPNAYDDEFFDFESKKLQKDTEIVTMLVFDDVGAIVGVDEKVYGPFRPQDIVTLPLINAKIFFKNRKGRQVKI